MKLRAVSARPDREVRGLAALAPVELRAVGAHARVEVVQLAEPALAVAAQLKSESKVCWRFIILPLQALHSRRIQRGFDTVNLHHPTLHT
jgi:hypothetical protein